MILPINNFATAQKSSQTTATVTISSVANIVAGNLIVVFVSQYGAGVTMAVTDGLGNTYSQAGSTKFCTSTDTNYGASVFYTVVTTGGACTITVTPSGSAYISAGAVEFSGNTATPLDGTANGAGLAATFDAGNVAVSAAIELVCAAFVFTASFPTSSAVPLAPMLGALAVGSGSVIPLIGLAGIASAAFNPSLLTGASVSYAGACASFGATSGGGGGTTIISISGQTSQIFPSVRSIGYH